MENTELEKYYFYRLYSIDFDSTKHALRVLKRYSCKDVRYCLLRDIVVSYVRPFSINKGKNIPKHTLTKKVVPKELHPLHDELVDLRNQLFAHTDYEYIRPKAANFSTPTRKWSPMSFRAFDYNKIDSRIAEIEFLVAEVEKNLQDKINKIEATF